MDHIRNYDHEVSGVSVLERSNQLAGDAATAAETLVTDAHGGAPLVRSVDAYLPAIDHRSGNEQHGHTSRRYEPFGAPERPTAPEAQRGWQEGDPIPPPRDGAELPADAELLSKYRGEDDPNNDSRFFRPSTVHYMDAVEREQHRLFVDGDGKLRSAHDGCLFGDRFEQYIFVMDTHGNLYATVPEWALIHHSSLIAGENVVGAGDMIVDNGELRWMSDRSGHYKPTPEMNDLVLQVLLEQGLRPWSDFVQADASWEPR
jgi:hypothetical protein